MSILFVLSFVLREIKLSRNTEIMSTCYLFKLVFYCNEEVFKTPEYDKSDLFHSPRFVRI